MPTLHPKREIHFPSSDLWTEERFFRLFHFGRFLFKKIGRVIGELTGTKNIHSFSGSTVIFSSDGTGKPQPITCSVRQQTTYRRNVSAAKYWPFTGTESVHSFTRTKTTVCPDLAAYSNLSHGYYWTSHSATSMKNTEAAVHLIEQIRAKEKFGLIQTSLSKGSFLSCDRTIRL